MRHDKDVAMKYDVQLFMEWERSISEEMVKEETLLKRELDEVRK